MFTTKSISCLFSVLVIIVFMLAVTPLQAAQAAGVLYVKQVYSGTGDCSSWANACVLQTALTGAVSGDEIWVAAGVYKPTTNTINRTATFQLIGGVAVYGGFAGTETSRTQRNPTANVTILSGDIDNNDSQTPIITDLGTVTGNTTNSYHVVTGATNATLDGFTITAGNANGTSGPNNYGGGMYNYYSNPLLMNVTFSGNSAAGGGGMYNEGSNPVLTNVTFNGNSVPQGGGGMYNSYSNPTLTNITFSGDSAADFGGGMYNISSYPTLTNVTFSDNSATSYGGGMCNMGSSPTLTNVTFSGNSADEGGGLYNGASSPTLTNVTFSSNSASSYGGGMYNLGSSNPLLTNITFSGNSATDFGGGMYNTYSSPSIRNTIFWGNTAGSGAQIYNADGDSKPSIVYNVLQGVCPTGSTCTIIITTDPKFGILGNYGGFTQTIPILPCSSAIDTGNDGSCPATDQRGILRPQGAHCDIGAFEEVQYAISGNVGVAGATLSYTDGSAKMSTADGSGNYAFTVSYDWSGTVTPSKIGYAFTPTDDAYTNVIAYQTGQNYTATPIATFADVPTTYWAWSFIERLYSAGITGGCGTSPLTYCPDSSVTRAQMAIFLERGMNGSSYTPPPATGTIFGDVPISYWDAAWIEKLSADGITGGCGGGDYCPGNPVTRAQMAIFLLRAEHGSSYTPPPATGTVFGDVPIVYWDAAWIEQLYAEGITGGCGGGDYCPANPVTRAQMAVFLVRTFSLP